MHGGHDIKSEIPLKQFLLAKLMKVSYSKRFDMFILFKSSSYSVVRKQVEGITPRESHRGIRVAL